MEEWELDFKWLEIRHQIQDRFSFKSLPDLQAILFIIGIQEFGRIQKSFSKEEKQDLMHIAVCKLLEFDGVYEFEGRDQDGWPHWKLIKPLKTMPLDEQEILIKRKIIHYFGQAENKE